MCKYCLVCGVELKRPGDGLKSVAQYALPSLSSEFAEVRFAAGGEAGRSDQGYYRPNDEYFHCLAFCARHLGGEVRCGRVMVSSRVAILPVI